MVARGDARTQSNSQLLVVCRGLARRHNQLNDVLLNRIGHVQLQYLFPSGENDSLGNFGLVTCSPVEASRRANLRMSRSAAELG